MENFLENLLAEATEMQTALADAKANDAQCFNRMVEMIDYTSEELNNMFGRLGVRDIYVYVGRMNGASAPIIVCDPTNIKTEYTIGHIQCPYKKHTIHGKEYTTCLDPHYVIYEPYSTSRKTFYGDDLNAFLMGCQDKIREILFNHLQATK